MKKGLIIFLWVMHVSALIGIALGYENFFYPKSPITLVYIAMLCILFYPVNKVKKVVAFSICFLTGMSVEWIGVHSGYLFGDYYYGINMGPKLDGIPYLIGLNWAVLTLITHQLSRSINTSVYVTPAMGASLMVFIDFFLEQICDVAGFWHFNGGAGWFNYLCWWVIAYILHLCLHALKIKGDRAISLHLYLVQLVFAAILWMIISI